MPIQPILHPIVVADVRHALLEVQLQGRGDSETHATKIPGLVRFSQRKVIEGEQQTALDELEAEIAVIFFHRVSGDLAEQRSFVFALRSGRKDRPHRQNGVDDHQIVGRLGFLGLDPSCESLARKNAISRGIDVNEIRIDIVHGDFRVDFVRIVSPTERMYVVCISRKRLPRYRGIVTRRLRSSGLVGRGLAGNRLR